MTPQTTRTPERKAFDRQLDSGLLMAEAEDGIYEPVAMVSAINEALELAGDNLRRRMKELERGREPMYPARYAVWARGFEGFRAGSTRSSSNSPDPLRLPDSSPAAFLVVSVAMPSPLDVPQRSR